MQNLHILFHSKEYSLQSSIKNKSCLLNFRRIQKALKWLGWTIYGKGYKENIIENQIEKVDNLARSTLLNKCNAVQKNIIPFSVTYSPTLPNIREIITKYWHILNISNMVGALTSFHFNDFLKNFDMFSQYLVQSITKKSHFLLIGSGITTTYQYILKSIENLLIQNYFYSMAKKYK